jgi:uncharacterized protein
MIIELQKIPPEGVALAEKISPEKLELEVECGEFRTPVTVTGKASCAYNVATVALRIETRIQAHCSRCLKEYEIDFAKNLSLNYPVEKTETAIDLNPEIREEILVNFPYKTLCKPECLGLCPRCGTNLNEGGCSCGTT